MLAWTIVFLVLAAACFCFGLTELSDIGLAVAYHLAAGVCGVVACTLFVVWTCGRIFGAGL